jgi:hypothetical protein
MRRWKAFRDKFRLYIITAAAMICVAFYLARDTIDYYLQGKNDKYYALTKALNPNAPESKLKAENLIILIVLLLLIGFIIGGKPEIGKQHIKGAPGSILLRIVEFFYSPAAVEETFKPIIADWRTEYFDALQGKRVFKARWINLRYIIAFVMAMGLSKFYSLVKSFISVGR